MSNDESTVSEMKVGTRVEVYWSGDDEYYEGTVCEKSNDVNGSRVFIEYDDGDDEWIDMHSTKITVTHKDNSHMINDKATLSYLNNLQVGSRVSVWWSNKKLFYSGTIIKLKEGAKYPHYLKYDDGDREWANLFLRRCKLINSTSKTTERSNNNEKSTLPPKKRKYDESDNSEEVANNMPRQTCGICKIAIAKKPRAVSCYHIFCKDCIATHCREHSKSCPICNTPISEVFKPDEKHDSFVAVKALEIESGQLNYAYVSASTAAIALNLDPIRIIDACRSEIDDSEYANHYWRFQRENISGSSDATPSRQINSNGKDGNSHEHSTESVSLDLRPVEMLDYQTGDVLKTFKSLVEGTSFCIKKSNYELQNIRGVCDGKLVAAFGLFWRWKDSDNLPQHLVGITKTPQIMKSPNDIVATEFQTVQEARAFFDSSISWSSISRWCREESFNLGYYWMYKYTREPTGFIESCISKRILVFDDSNNKWHEGKVMVYDKKSKKFKISFDGDRIEYHRLEEIRYEWKNDEWQKPIELVDIHTKEILTTFKTATDAYFALSIPDLSSISILGEKKNFNGFFLRYKNLQEDSLKREPKANGPNSRIVEQVCLDSGRLLCTYNSITDAGKVLNVSTTSISYCCSKRPGYEHASGFKWRFVVDDEDV